MEISPFENRNRVRTCTRSDNATLTQCQRGGEEDDEEEEEGEGRKRKNERESGFEVGEEGERKGCKERGKYTWEEERGYVAR